MCSIDNEESDGIALPNKVTMKGLKEGDSWKCLGVIQVDGTKHHEMKEKVKTEYYRRVRKMLETKLNIITGMNTWANFITKILSCLSRLDRSRIRANGL